jgi:uncharacterized protein involved in tellurium resistance
VSPRSPQSAPPRPDLTYLRRRSRPAAPAAVPPALADFLSGHDPHHPPSHAHPAPTPGADASLDLSAPTPAAASSLDLSAPTPASTPAPSVSSSLDLSAPTPVAPTPAPAASSSLDLSAPTPVAPTPAPAASSSLDLSPAPQPSVLPAMANAPFKPKLAPARAYLPPRVRAGTATVLTAKAPTVTLTRVQSGIGSLVIEAACSPAVGDLRLGAAYQLNSGPTSVVQRESDVNTAPPGSRRPVIIGQRSQFEKLTIDLVQIRDLQRCVLYAYSAGGGQLNWGGTLVLTTFGQARVEIALDRQPSGAVVVLMSLFVVDGEVVIRSENEEIAGSVRDATLAYGFDRITWLDSRTPLT